MVMIMLSPALAQWSTAVVTGGAEHIGTAFDTVYAASNKLKVTFPDTTMTGYSGKRAIVWNLNDERWMHDLGKFRSEEKLNSYYPTLGQLPTYGAAIISTAGDTTSLWDLTNLAAGPWMVFRSTANKVFHTNTVMNDVKMLDGIFYIATQGGTPYLGLVNFRDDEITSFSTTGFSRHWAKILAANTTAGSTLITQNLEIQNADVFSTGAFRDPFGNTLDGWPQHHWMAGTSDGPTVFFPYGDDDAGDAVALNSLDGGMTSHGAAGGDHVDVVSFPRGGYFSINQQTPDRLTWNESQLNKATTAWNPDEYWSTSGTTGEDLAVATVMQTVTGFDRGLINDAPVAYLGSDDSFYILNANPQNNNESMKTLIDNGWQHPPELGDAVGAYALGDGSDGTPYNNTLTAVGNGAFVSGTGIVFGNAYSTTDNGTDSYLHHAGAAGSEYNDGGGRSFSVWVKTGDQSSEAKAVFGIREQTNPENMYFQFSGTNCYPSISSWAASQGSSSYNADSACDGEWHHYAGRSVSSDKVHTVTEYAMELWIDGKLADNNDTAETITLTNLDADTLTIGMRRNNGSYDRECNCLISQLAIYRSTNLSVKMIQAIHKAGRASLGAGIDIKGGLHSADVDYTDAKRGSVISGDEDSLQIWTAIGPHLIPQSRHDPGSTLGSIQDATLIEIPGADSMGWLAVGTTGIRFVQPDVRIVDASSWRSDYVQPKAVIGGAVVADSSGKEGVFWHFSIAGQAAWWAEQNLVQLRAGTYPSGNFGASTWGNNMTLQGTGMQETTSLDHAWRGVSLVDGGALSAIIIASANITIRDLVVRTTPGKGNDIRGISSTGSRLTIRDVACDGSDNDCFFTSGGEQFRMFGTKIFDADRWGVYMNTPNSTIANNWVSGDVAAYGFYCDSGGDNALFTGNYNQNATGGILVGGCDNSYVSSDINNVAWTNSSTGSQVLQETY